MKDGEGRLPLHSVGAGTLGRWTARRALRSVPYALLPSFLSRSAQGADHANAKPISPTAWLDGLRGIAALAVFVFHFCFRTFTTTFAYGQKDGDGQKEHLQWLRLPFIRILYSGAPWVSIFFIISGYVLSVRPLRQMRSQDYDKLTRSLGSSVLRRPIRLYFPCILSSLIVFLMIRLGVYETTRPTAENLTYFPVLPHETHEVRQASLHAQLSHWYKAISELIHNGFSDNFFGANFSYDVHLWTIPSELRSSFFLFLALMLVSRMRPRARMMTFLFLIWWSVDGGKWEMMLFYAGAIIAELDLIKAASSRSVPLFLSDLSPETLRGLYVVNIVIGLYLCSFPEEKPDTTPGFVILDSLVPVTFPQRFRFWHSVGAIQLVWTISNWPVLQRALTTSPVRYVGRVSYGVYLMHGPVIHSLGYAILPFFWNLAGANAGFAMCGAVVLGAVVWAGDVFERVADVPCVQFGRWLALRIGVEE